MSLALSAIAETAVAESLRRHGKMQPTPTKRRSVAHRDAVLVPEAR